MNSFFSQTKNVLCCVPQGSTLVPALRFLIFINDLKNAQNKCIIHHFANDTNLLFGNKCLSEISCVMNNELKLLIGLELTFSHSFSLNESKQSF